MYKVTDMTKEAMQILNAPAGEGVDCFSNLYRFSEWKQFSLKIEDLAGKKVLYVYISDNVLDRDAHTLAKVTIDPKTGRFLTISALNQGIYGIPCCRNFQEVIERAHMDPTGGHPEVYFQVRTWEWLGRTSQVPSEPPENRYEEYRDEED